MKFSSRASHLALGVVLTSLAACNSSDSGNDQVQDDPSAVEADSEEDEDLISLNPISGGDQSGSDDSDTVITIDDDPDDPGGEIADDPDENNGGGTDVGTGADAGEEETGGNTDEGAGGDTDEGTGGDTDEETGGDTDEETGGDTDEEIDILIPQVNGNSDLDRLIEGLTRQASITLLDLNRRITQGLFISNLRQLCIGDFDAGLGEALIGIDCAPRTLSTAGIDIAVEEAAFYNTAVCQESLFEQSTNSCFLERISIELDTVFEIPTVGTNPIPVFPGADVEYAINGTILRITNIEPAVTGEFSCVLDLSSNILSVLALSPACADVIESVADQIEQLQDI